MSFYDLEINSLEFLITKGRGKLINWLECSLLLFILIEVFYSNLFVCLFVWV